LVTLLLVAGLFWSARLNVAAALFSGVIATAVSALFNGLGIPRDLFGHVGAELLDESRALLRFGKWLWLSAIFRFSPCSST
jgi:O-antigen/teichoic acid export membrane protein